MSLEVDLDETRFRYFTISEMYAKSMFFGISAQNDAELWYHYRNVIDFRYSSEELKFVGIGVVGRDG